MNDTPQSTSQASLDDAEIASIITALQNGASISDVCNVSTEMLEGLYTLGYNLYTSGNFTDANTIFQALCLYKHSEPRFWMGLGGCRQANDNLIGAVDAYAMAGVVSGMADPTPFLYAATCYIKLGDKDNATGALRGLLTMGNEADPAHRSSLSRGRELLNMLEKSA